MAFVRNLQSLPPDVKYPPDLDKLSFYLGEDDRLHHKDLEELNFSWRATNDTRHNIVRLEALHDAVRNIIIDRFEDLGLRQFFVPSFSYNEEREDHGPQLPILITPHDQLLKKKRIFVFVTSSSQDLGTLSWRLLERRGGIEKGSLLEMVRQILRVKWPSPNVDDVSSTRGQSIADEVNRGVKRQDEDFVPVHPEWGFPGWHRSEMRPRESGVTSEAGMPDQADMNGEKVDDACAANDSSDVDTLIGSDTSDVSDQGIRDRNQAAEPQGEAICMAAPDSHESSPSDIAMSTPSSAHTPNDMSQTCGDEQTSEPVDSLSDAVQGLTVAEKRRLNEKLLAALFMKDCPSSLDNEAPGIVILNPGQLRYTYTCSEHVKRKHASGRAVSTGTWEALPRPSAVHPSRRIERHNQISGNHDASAHVAYCFRHIVDNTAFIDRDAKLHLIGIEDGADKLLEHLALHWKTPMTDYYNRISTISLMNPSPMLKDVSLWDDLATRNYEQQLMMELLRTRGRIWTCSPKPVGTALASTTFLPMQRDPETEALIKHDPRVENDKFHKGLEFSAKTPSPKDSKAPTEFEELNVSPVVSGGHGKLAEYLLPKCHPDVLAWMLKIEKLGEDARDDDWHNEVWPVGLDESSEDDEAFGDSGWGEDLEPVVPALAEPEAESKESEAEAA